MGSDFLGSIPLTDRKTAPLTKTVKSAAAEIQSPLFPAAIFTMPLFRDVECGAEARRRESAVRQSQNVIVHNDCENQQEEDHADRDEALFDANAQIAAYRAFDEQ